MRYSFPTTIPGCSGVTNCGVALTMGGCSRLRVSRDCATFSKQTSVWQNSATFPNSKVYRFQLPQPRRVVTMTRVRLWVAGALAALCIAAVTVAKNKPKTSNTADEHRRTVHALDRLTFGPRPGNADTVSAMGVDKWIELQLDPEKIDDSAIEARLEQYRTLRMSTREMVM